MSDLLNKITLGDCLDVMQRIPDQSVDMVLCDLPYGVTACAWDAVIPFDALWAQYNRVVKKRGAVVLTATQPFCSALVMSNPKNFRHEWVWDKVIPSGFNSAKFRPMQRHEHVLVFAQKSRYHPIMTPCAKVVMAPLKIKSESSPLTTYNKDQRVYTEKYPQSILTYCKRDKGTFHPTQKPVQLFEYLVKTYSLPGETVLDNCIGSGTTAVASIRTGRRFIGIEKDPEIHALACKRVEAGRLWKGGRPSAEKPKTGFKLW